MAKRIKLKNGTDEWEAGRRKLLGGSQEPSPFHQDLSMGFLERGLEIDKNNLDEGLARQPTLYKSAGDAMAEAINRRDGAEDALRIAKARAFLRVGVKKRNGKKGYAELTQEGIKAKVELHPLVLAARKVLNDAQLHVDKMASMEQSFRSRGFALKDMVELHKSSHYQTDSVGDNSSRNYDRDHDVYLQQRKERARRRHQQEDDD